MNRSINLMVESFVVAGALAGIAVPAVAAEPTIPNKQVMTQGQAQGQGQGQGQGTPSVMPCYGPGMMGGGYGPGMMGGGYGPGMMGGGYGPGMMGGGYGPGMMGGGYGPGMMGGGYGPGMMGWGYGRGFAGLNLTPDQVSKIEKIRDDLSKAYEPLAQQMFQARNKMQESYIAGNADPAEIKKSYAKISELRKKMFDLSIDAQKRMDDVLTKDQRQQQRAWRGSMMGY